MFEHLSIVTLASQAAVRSLVIDPVAHGNDGFWPHGLTLLPYSQEMNRSEWRSSTFSVKSLVSICKAA